jgi:O-methyltransferase
MGAHIKAQINSVKYFGVKKLLKRLFLYYGYDVARISPKQHFKTVNPCLLSRYENESHDPYLCLYKEALTKTKSVDAFDKQTRFFVVYQMIKRIFTHQISGNVVECGCFKGHSTYIIASLLKTHEFSNAFYVFDSFEGGLSDKQPQDRTGKGKTAVAETLRQKLYFSSSEQEVKKLLAPFPFTKVYNGWIPEVFDQAKITDELFSLVHIDVDLYQPIKDSLKFVFPRMTRGGVIIIDDYGHSQFPGAKRAVDEFLIDKKVTMTLENNLSGYLILV